MPLHRLCVVTTFAVACVAAPVAGAADVQTQPPGPGYQIQCFEDPGTRYQYCFAPSKLTANGPLRASPLFGGKGPELARTALTAVADCKKSTIALRDAKGTTPSDAPKLEARVAEAMARDMCAVAKPAVDKALKP